MAQTTSLVFNGGVIPSPSPAPSGSGKAKLLKIGEITVTEQEVQVTKNVICDPDSLTTVAPFMEVLTSARLAELISANNILVLDDGTMQYLMSDATISVEDGTSVCTAVNFLGLSKENRAKVLYPCTRLTDELTLQQVLEVGEPVETDFNLVKADSADTEPGTLIDKLEIEDTIDDDHGYQPLLEIHPADGKVAINEDNLHEVLDGLGADINNVIETIDGLDVDSVPHAYLHSTLAQSAGDSVTTGTPVNVFAQDALEGDCFEFEQTTTIDDTPFGYVWIEPGTYLINASVTLQWVGNPRGTFLAKVGSVMGENFDFSQEQEIKRNTTKVVTIPNRMKLSVNITYDAGTPVMGFWIQSMQVVKLSGGMSQTNITHDGTLVGQGSVADPLRVDEAKVAQSALAGNLAPAFDPTRTEEDPYIAYKDSCVYEGELYLFTTNHYGAWNPAHATISGQNALLQITAQNALASVKALPTKIKAFRFGDVVLVDGSNGLAQMDATKLATLVDDVDYENYSASSTYSDTKSGYYADTNGYHADSNFITYIQEVESDSLLFVSSYSGVYFSVTVYPNSSQTGGTRYRNIDNNLPSSSTPLFVAGGSYVAFTTKFNTFNVALGEIVGVILADGIKLNEPQKQSVLDNVFTSVLEDAIYTQRSDYTDIKAGYSADVNGYTADANFKTWVLEATHSGSLSVNSFGGNYCAITIYPDSRQRNGTRYRNIDSNLPDSENPISIVKGNYIAITTRYESFSLTLADYVLKRVLLDDVVFGDEQIKEILKSQNSILCEFINESGEGSSTQRFEVNVPSKSGYIRYTYVHSVNNSKDCDCWRLNTVYKVDADRIIPLSPTSGEWELAVRLRTDNDYVGGCEHGHENINSAIFFIDGVQTALADMPSGLFMCKEFSAVTSSTVSSLANVDFATHGVSHVFTSNGCKLTQSLKFLTNVRINHAFLCMGLALRTRTSKYYTDAEVVAEDFPESSFTSESEVKSIRIFGDVSLDIAIQKYPFLSDKKMLLTHYTTDNKFYAIVCRNDDHPVVAGEVLNSMHEIRFSAG